MTDHGCDPGPGHRNSSFHPNTTRLGWWRVKGSGLQGRLGHRNSMTWGIVISELRLGPKGNSRGKMTNISMSAKPCALPDKP